jgi:hypothetical protein
LKRREKTESCEKREIRGRYEKKKKGKKKGCLKKQRKRKRKLNKEFESVEVLR